MAPPVAVAIAHIVSLEFNIDKRQGVWLDSFENSLNEPVD